MDDKILTNEQWSELWQAIDLYDRTNDRTALDRTLVSIMKNLVESLDDDDAEAKDESEQEKQLVITLIENELAQIIDGPGCPCWCCHGRRRQIQPSGQNNHRFSDYLINLARAKALDPNNRGFISKELIQRVFGTQVSIQKMAELLQFVGINRNGDVNYKEFATLTLISNYQS